MIEDNRQDGNESAAVPLQSPPEQPEKRCQGAPVGNQNATTHGKRRRTKRTRAEIEDPFDRRGREAAAKLYDKGDDRRQTYAANWAAWRRLQDRLDKRGWTLANGEIKNAVTVWRDLSDRIDKAQAERRKELHGQDGGKATYTVTLPGGSPVDSPSYSCPSCGFEPEPVMVTTRVAGLDDSHLTPEEKAQADQAAAEARAFDAKREARNAEARRKAAAKPTRVEKDTKKARASAESAPRGKAYSTHITTGEVRADQAKERRWET